MIERVSTHILNTSLGVPALGVPGLLEQLEAGGRWQQVGAGTTDADGRIGKLNEMSVLPGDFRLTFDTADYFRTAIGTVFYPAIVLQFRLDGQRRHYHIPVLASTYSYSTYLGS